MVLCCAVLSGPESLLNASGPESFLNASGPESLLNAVSEKRPTGALQDHCTYRTVIHELKKNLTKRIYEINANKNCSYTIISSANEPEGGFVLIRVCLSVCLYFSRLIFRAYFSVQLMTICVAVKCKCAVVKVILCSLK